MNDILARLQQWITQETRLIGLNSWADGAYHGPPSPPPFTSRHPACNAVLERQQALYAKMRRMKSHLLDREEGITSAAHTDIRNTIHRAQSVKVVPVREARRARA